jgi:hypothetical protein
MVERGECLGHSRRFPQRRMPASGAASPIMNPKTRVLPWGSSTGTAARVQGGERRVAPTGAKTLRQHPPERDVLLVERDLHLPGAEREQVIKRDQNRFSVNASRNA